MLVLIVHRKQSVVVLSKAYLAGNPLVLELGPNSLLMHGISCCSAHIGYLILGNYENRGFPATGGPKGDKLGSYFGLQVLFHFI